LVAQYTDSVGMPRSDDVDDRACPLGREVAERGLAAEYCALEVDVHHQVDLLLGNIRDRRMACEAGVVDPDIESAEGIARRAYGFGMTRGGCDITCDRSHAAGG